MKKKEVIFELGLDGFLNGNDVFSRELTNIVKSNTEGCLLDGRFRYILDVFVSNERNNIKNSNFVVRCEFNLSCDKLTNLNILSYIYEDILSNIERNYIIKSDYIYGEESGVVYKYISFCLSF